MEDQRPTFLVAEPEAPDGLSSRKLVLETGKFNVLTAHSAKETLAVLDRFPHVDAVVLHVNLSGSNCNDLVKEIRQRRAQVPVIILTPNQAFSCDGADDFVHSHDPEALLTLLRQSFGDPRV